MLRQTWRMTRLLKPLFGSRHHRETPKWTLGEPPKGAGKRPRAEPDVKPVWNLGDPPRSWWQRFDWPLAALVAAVFLVGFVWLFSG